MLTATQTDTTWNLVSVKSSSVTVTVYAQPAAPVITFVSTPAQTKTTTQVTVKGTGISGETITLYDGSTQVGTARWPRTAPGRSRSASASVSTR